MKLSARNQFQGTVKIGHLEFIAAITEGSLKTWA
jgi:molybdopterin-binding protein